MGNGENENNVPEERAAVAVSREDAPVEIGDLLKDPSRRLFFKRAAVGGGAALLGGAGAYGASMVSLNGRAAPDYPPDR